MKTRKPFHVDSVDIKAGGGKAEERTGGGCENIKPS